MLRNLISQGLAQVQALAGEALEYRRGDLALPVRGIFGEQVTRVLDAEGRMIEKRRLTIRLLASQLIALGHPDTAGEPREGDRLVRDLAGRRQILRVVPDPDRQNSCWQWSDRLRSQYTIHVREIREHEL